MQFIALQRDNVVVYEFQIHVVPGAADHGFQAFHARAVGECSSVCAEVVNVRFNEQRASGNTIRQLVVCNRCATKIPRLGKQAQVPVVNIQLIEFS